MVQTEDIHWHLINSLLQLTTVCELGMSVPANNILSRSCSYPTYRYCWL